MFLFKESISWRFRTKVGIAHMEVITMMWRKADIFHIAQVQELESGTVLPRMAFGVMTRQDMLADMSSHGRTVGRSGLFQLAGGRIEYYEDSLMSPQQRRSIC
jgi:hypothetical protein